MMKIFISDAVVSKGYDGAPAIRFSIARTAASLLFSKSETANMIAVRRTITGGST